LKITRLPQYKCKEGDSSIDLFPSPKLIDTMDVSDIGWSRYYNLTINCSAGNYFDEGDLYDDPVEVEFMYGFCMYGFRLELNDSIVELYASCIAVYTPVGGTVVPVDKFGLLAPYIGLVSTVFVATVVTATCVKHVKQRKVKNT
jgi:hypothetical protein